MNVKVRDIIARMNGGKCGLCANRRFICSCLGNPRPDHTGQLCTPFVLETFYAFVGFCMAVPCPVCMGMFLFTQFIKTLFRHNSIIPMQTATHAQLSQILSLELKTLGYPSSLGLTAEQISEAYERGCQDQADEIASYSDIQVRFENINILYF
jgi:hypothetical protein